LKCGKRKVTEMLNFEISGPLSDQVASSLVVIVLLSIAIILVGLKVEKLKATDTPKGLVLVMVMFFEAVQNMIAEHFPGKKLRCSDHI